MHTKTQGGNARRFFAFIDPATPANHTGPVHILHVATTLKSELGAVAMRNAHKATGHDYADGIGMIAIPVGLFYRALENKNKALHTIAHMECGHILPNPPFRPVGSNKMVHIDDVMDALMGADPDMRTRVLDRIRALSVQRKSLDKKKRADRKARRAADKEAR